MARKGAAKGPQRVARKVAQIRRIRSRKGDAYVGLKKVRKDGRHGGGEGGAKGTRSERKGDAMRNGKEDAKETQ